MNDKSNVATIVPEEGWFFTFGSGQLLPKQVIVMRSMSNGEARRLMHSMIGPHWSFDYPIKDLPEQQRNWGYTVARELTREDLPTDLRDEHQ